MKKILFTLFAALPLLAAAQPRDWANYGRYAEANALLDKAGLLKDNPQRPGLPLRNKLRKGELPYAYQVAGKGSEWVIPLSTAERPAEVKKGSAFRRVARVCLEK